MRKAIVVASSDHGHKLKERRDAIVQRLYACRSCDEVNRQQNLPAIWGDNEAKVKHSPYTPQSVPRDEDVDIENEDEEPDPFGGLFDDEETMILTIKEQIEDPEQSDESLVELLQGLSDMDITFKGLKTYSNPLQNNPAYSVVKQYFVDFDDTVAQKIVVHKDSPRGTHFCCAGPRQKVYFQSDDVHVCIVTCGGLCPGLNTVIREIVCGLYHMYGVKRVVGIDLLYRKYSGNFLLNLLGKWQESEYSGQSVQVGGLAYYVTAPSRWEIVYTIVFSTLVL